MLGEESLITINVNSGIFLGLLLGAKRNGRLATIGCRGFSWEPSMARQKTNC